MTHSVCDMTCHAFDKTHMPHTGEIIGGLHGKNRLGGNALSECVVFGRVIGNRIAASLGARAHTHTPSEKGGGWGGSLGDAPAESPLVEVSGGVGSKEITKEEMGKHNSEASCWVSIDDKVCAYECAHSCVRARARVCVRVRMHMRVRMRMRVRVRMRVFFSIRICFPWVCDLTLFSRPAKSATSTSPHAKHYNTLQHTATLQRTATHCSTMQHTATLCNTIQRTATHCITDQQSLLLLVVLLFCANTLMWCVCV